MTPARIAEIAESAWPAGHETTSILAIERAIRLAVNEAMEEAAKAIPANALGYMSHRRAIRALKLPEE